MRHLKKREVFSVWHQSGMPNSLKTAIWKNAGYSSSKSVTNHIEYWGDDEFISLALQRGIQSTLSEEKWNYFYDMAKQRQAEKNAAKASSSDNSTMTDENIAIEVITDKNSIIDSLRAVASTLKEEDDIDVIIEITTLLKDIVALGENKINYQNSLSKIFNN